MFRKRFLLLLSGKSVKLFVEYIGVYLLQSIERLQLMGLETYELFSDDYWKTGCRNGLSIKLRRGHAECSKPVSLLTFVHSSRPVLEPAQPPIHLLTAALFFFFGGLGGVKWTRRRGHLYLIQRLMRGGKPPPCIHLHGMVPNKAQEKHCTFYI
jgi:hypothetical protein